MRVLLLNGGSSNEREVSLRSGQAVTEAVAALGHDLTVADPSDPAFDLENAVKSVDVVFLALHGHGGEDGFIQKQLESLHIPYTGSNSSASALCFDKWRYKQFLLEHGLPVTEGRLVSLHRLDESLFQTPYVLKPCDEGSSLDTQIVRKPTEETRAVSQHLLETHAEMLLETLVEGTEITVGIFGDEALPVIEIIPPEGREFDYANKYNGATQELCPPEHVDERTQKEARELTLHIHRLTGCEHMSRTDLMIDTKGKLHIIETNTIPGLTSQSLLPKMVLQAGNTMPEFIDKLLQMALSRQQ